MDVAATEAIAQGWCEPETSGQEMDVVLAEAIARPVSQVLRAWYDTAAQYARNEEYYRGLVQEIGAMFGEEAYISDDGSKQQDVLCSKVPELVRAKMEDHSDAYLAALRENVQELVGDLRSFAETHRSAFNAQAMAARIEEAADTLEALGGGWQDISTVPEHKTVDLWSQSRGRVADCLYSGDDSFWDSSYPNSKRIYVTGAKGRAVRRRRAGG